MFEKASRLKLRFNYKGVLSVEDLWDLPFTGLDAIFKKLNAELKTQKEESLLDTKSKLDKILELKVAIVKHIFTVKRAEKDAEELKAEKKAKKEKILEIIEEKQEDSLKGKSIEDLTKMLDDL